MSITFFAGSSKLNFCTSRVPLSFNSCLRESYLSTLTILFVISFMSQKSVFSAWFSTSDTPLCLLMMTGVPFLRLSSATSPNGSLTEGMTYRSAVWNALYTSSPCNAPVKVILSPMFNSAALCIIFGSMSPFPTIMNRVSFSCSSTFFATSMK